MTCNRATDIHRYHDGELAPADRDAIESHLQSCAPCRQLLEDLRRISSLLASAERPAISTAAVERLRQCPRCARDRGVLRLTGWMTAAAAAVLIVALLKQPAEQPELAAGPAIWQTVAVTPPTEMASAVNTELFVMAQWMADDLAPASNGDYR